MSASMFLSEDAPAHVSVQNEMEDVPLLTTRQTQSTECIMVPETDSSLLQETTTSSNPNHENRVLESDSDDCIYEYPMISEPDTVMSDAEIWDKLRRAIELCDVELARALLVRVKDARVLAEALHRCTRLYCNTNHEQVLTKFGKRHRLSKMNIIQEIIATAVQTPGNKNYVLESCDDTGRTPLFCAIVKGDLDAVKVLMTAGAPLEYIRSETGETALHIAAKDSLIHILTYLLENYANRIDYLPNNNGWYPIHCATWDGEVNTVKLLLTSFSAEQLMMRNPNCQTCWHLLTTTTSTVFDDIAQRMLEAGEPLNRRYLNEVDGRGDSPVSLLAGLGRPAAAALLLRKGAALSVEGEEDSAIKNIVKGIRNPSTFLEDVFDECIYEEANKVCVDYNVLTDGKKMSQIEVINELVRCCNDKPYSS